MTAMDTETPTERRKPRSILKSSCNILTRIKNLGTHILSVCFNICPTVQEYYTCIDENDKDAYTEVLQNIRNNQNKDAGQGGITAYVGKVPEDSKEGAVLNVAINNQCLVRSWRLHRQVFNDKNGVEVDKTYFSMKGRKMCNLIIELDTQEEGGILSSGTYHLLPKQPGVHSKAKAYVHPYVETDKSQTQVTVGYWTHLAPSLSTAKQVELALQAIKTISPDLPPVNLSVDGNKGKNIIRAKTALGDRATVLKFMEDKKRGGTLLLTKGNVVTAVFDRNLAIEMQGDKNESSKARDRHTSDKVILVVNTMAMEHNFQATQVVRYAGVIVNARIMHTKELKRLKKTEQAICLTVATDAAAYAEEIQTNIDQRSGPFCGTIPQQALVQAFSIEVGDGRIAATSIMSADFQSQIDTTNRMKLETLRQREWLSRVKELHIPHSIDQWPQVAKAATTNDWTGLNYNQEHKEAIEAAYVEAYSLTELPETNQEDSPQQTTAPQRSNAPEKSRLEELMESMLTRMTAVETKLDAELSKITHEIKVLNLRTSKIEDYLTTKGNPESSSTPTRGQKRQAGLEGTYTRPVTYTQKDLDDHADRLGKQADSGHDETRISSTLTEKSDTSHIKFSNGHVS